MELTEPEESADLDSAAFALHSMHLAICTAAFAFNSFLLYLLRKCSAFHSHMKIIMINQTMAVMAADVYLFLRSSLGLWQTYDGTVKPKEIPIDDSQCAFSASVPDSLCMLFIWFPFLLMIERFYASQNYESYEHNEAPIIFKVLCGVMWLPMLCEVLVFCFSLSLPSNLQACQYSLLQQSHMQRNAWFVIIAFFSGLFAVFFKILEYRNKKIESHSVQNDYVFSCRYQIRENVKTCRFACSLLLLFFVFFAIFFLFDRNLDTKEGSKMVAAARREYLFLIFPMFALLYSIHFLTANSSLFQNAKRALQSYYYQEHDLTTQKRMPGRLTTCFELTVVIGVCRSVRRER